MSENPHFSDTSEGRVHGSDMNKPNIKKNMKAFLKGWRAHVNNELMPSGRSLAGETKITKWEELVAKMTPEEAYVCGEDEAWNYYCAVTGTKGERPKND